MENYHHFSNYHEAVLAHNVAIGLKWVVRIGFNGTDYWVHYVGKLK